MVLSLVDLCLLTLRKSIESGYQPKVYDLPLTLRQELLEKVLLRGKIAAENPRQLLSSIDFLIGFQSLDTQKGKVDDRRYLELVTASFRTIGRQITDLAVNLYRYRQNLNYEDQTSLEAIMRLISECPNLQALKVRFEDQHQGVAPYLYDKNPEDIADLDDQSHFPNSTEHAHIRNVINIDVSADEDETEGLPYMEDPDWASVYLEKLCRRQISQGGILNTTKIPPRCLPIIENLRELSLIGEGTVHEAVTDYKQVVLATHRLPIIQFRCLTDLRLIHMKVDQDGWSQFMTIVSATLIKLEVEKMKVFPNSDQTACLLPGALPRLRSFKSDRYSIGNLQRLIESLSDCPQLAYVSLSLITEDGLVPNLARLNQIEATLELELSLWINSRVEDALFETPSSTEFRLISVFKEKIKSLSFYVLEWSSQSTKALQHCLEVCQMVISLEFCVTSQHSDENDEHFRELERAKLAFGALFNHVVKAGQLSHLKLTGPFPVSALNSIFRYCINLETMNLVDMPQLTDQHLIDWSQRGAKPSRIILTHCSQVTDQGLIPILISSGYRLEEFTVEVHSSSSPLGSRITDRTWRVLIDQCPSLKRVTGFPGYLKEELRSRCFRDVKFE